MHLRQCPVCGRWHNQPGSSWLHTSCRVICQEADTLYPGIVARMEELDAEMNHQDEHALILGVTRRIRGMCRHTRGSAAWKFSKSKG